MPAVPMPDTSRPFRRGDAISAGVSPDNFRGSTFTRIFRGIYIASGRRVTPACRVEAAVLASGPSAFASHASAARWYAVPIPTIPEEHVTVTSPAHRRARAGIRCRLATGERVVEVDGLRVSSPARMFVELGSVLTLVDLVVVGDHLVRKGLVKLGSLVQFAGASNLPGAKQARLAASYVRERVDSPMETRLRMLIVLAGLPEPEVNLTVRAFDGEPLRRYDLCYPEARVIVEYDGRQHIEREEDWEKDLERREAIDDDEWRILVVISSGIYRHPERTLRRVERLLRRRGTKGLPARLDDAWRPHFPGR